MILPIVKYGHPVLRKKGARIERLSPEIQKLIDDMLETMRVAAGVGLAAQQVGHALQLTVLDIRAVKDRPSTMEVEGKTVDPGAFMPLVLINPQMTPVGPPVAGAEGCLSFPEMYADIVRPESIDVSATNEKGDPIRFRCGGLLARAVQHEADHLQGILFIDRMAKETKAKLKADLETLQAATKAELKQSEQG